MVARGKVGKLRADKQNVNLEVEERARNEACLAVEAMKRAEALDTRPTWHFFRQDLSPPVRRKFPKSSMPKESWTEPLLGKSVSERGCLV
jgi:hypothetical protein